MADGPILVASDLSSRADRPVDRAIRLGQQLGRPVCLVHVRDDEGEGGESEELERFVRRNLPDGSDDIEIYLPSGSVAEEIAHTADEVDAAAIVCGVARFNNFYDYIIGTAVDAIISRASHSVVVVKQRPQGEYRKLMVAIDFSDDSAHAAAAAVRLFPEAEITLVHAYKVAYEGLQQASHLRDETREEHEASLAEFLARPELAGLKGKAESKLVYGDVGGALLDASKELDPDLVVAGTHGAGAVRRATLGSTASQMLQWLPYDMMVVPPDH